jgi:sulfite reductase (NADPH) hemoprotein beta-component
MAKEFKPVIVTANDLIEGDSVFLGVLGWVRDIAEARVAMTADEASALEAAGVEGENGNLVVGPYLVEVALESGQPVPVLRREQIRADGIPTIPVGLDALPAERRAA